MWFVYGKRTEPWFSKKQNKMIEADKQFRALSADGIRVSRLTDACEFATKEDAEEFVNTHNFKPCVVLDIRKKA